MSTARPAPIMQVRVIGAVDHAQAVIADVTHRARALLGPGLTYRTATRSARRIGHVRVYLTITRKENPSHDQHDG